RVHGCALQARTACDELGWHAEMAHGAEPARGVLEGGHEARLPGRRLLDLPEICRPEEGEGRLALRAVLRVEDGHAEEVDQVPACDPRERHLCGCDDGACAEGR